MFEVAKCGNSFKSCADWGVSGQQQRFVWGDSDGVANESDRSKISEKIRSWVSMQAAPPKSRDQRSGNKSGG